MQNYLVYLSLQYLGLSEYGAFWKCVTAGFVYTVTQFAKMIFLATFFPAATGYDDNADGDEQGMHVQEVDQEEVPFIFLMVRGFFSMRQQMYLLIETEQT